MTILSYNMKNTPFDVYQAFSSAVKKTMLDSL